jgi:type II secretory pathway pseudopilin PulG
MREKILRQLFRKAFSKKPPIKRDTSSEGGYALLALILALTILSIVLTSSVAPNYQVASQREKEVELYYRGQQMAEGISRYYYNTTTTNPNALRAIQLNVPPPYGYLKELKKLKEGVTINLQERKFVRASATIDPFDGEEWEPVYARDPRIMPFLQAWATETGGIIPNELMLIAGAPIRARSLSPLNGSTTPSGSTTPGSSSNPQTGTSSGRGQTTTRPNNQDDDDDDDDDDDSGPGNDPLAHLFTGGSGLPIVGVAPRRKGLAIRPFYGLKNYEEWVFIFIPLNNRFTVPAPNTSGTPQNRISQ